MFIKWIHHLFNPHCIECAHEKECKSCIVLQEQLATVRFENKQLLEMLLPKKEVAPAIVEEELKPIKPRHIPWAVKQQLLEQQDRDKARILKKLDEERKDISQLEKELSINIPEDQSNAG